MQGTLKPRRSAIWQAIQRLDFISAFFSWAFMLAARLAEPTMLLSAIYVILEAGIPALALTWLHNLALAAMIAAPEIILPGAFVVASRARARGNTHATILYITCWAFIALTLTTLASLLTLHLDRDVMQWIMLARCAVGVGYSILIRVMFAAGQATIADQAATITPAAPVVDMEAIIDELDRRSQARIEALMASMTQTVTRIAIEQITTSLPAYRPPAPMPSPEIVEARPARREPLTQFKSAAKDVETKEAIRQLLLADPEITSRKAGELAGCSHTTAAAYLKELRSEAAA